MMNWVVNIIFHCQIKNHSVFSDSEYFKKLEESPFLPIYSEPLICIYGNVGSLIDDLRKLSSKSNTKVSKIIKNIINIYDEGKNSLSLEIELSLDNYQTDINFRYNLSEKEKKYIKYLTNQHQKLIVLYLIRLIKDLKKGLDKFLKYKE